MEGTLVRKYLFLGVFLCLLVLVARLFYPFMTIFVWSGLLYALLSPFHEAALRKWPGGPQSPAARRIVSIIFAVGGVLLVVLPFVYLAASLASQIIELNRFVRHAIDTNPNYLDLSPQSPIGGFFFGLTGGMLDLSQVRLQEELVNLFPRSANRLFQLSGVFLRSMASMVLGLVFMTITLFFLLMDGKQLLRLLVGAIPIEREYTRLFVRKLRSTARDLARGYALVMGIIGLIMYGVFSAFGVRGALFFGVLTALSTFVPVAGPGLVLFPIAALMALSSGLAPAVIMLAIGISVVTLVDTVVRPLLLKDRLEMHPLLILFAILGGIEVFGFNGVVLGPLILIVFFTSVQLYDVIYERGLDAENPEDE